VFVFTPGLIRSQLLIEWHSSKGVTFVHLTGLTKDPRITRKCYSATENKVYWARLITPSSGWDRRSARTKASDRFYTSLIEVSRVMLPSYRELSAPSVEPAPLDKAKQQMQMGESNTDDDLAVCALITAARQYVEKV
jgi:hypothetical protein